MIHLPHPMRYLLIFLLFVNCIAAQGNSDKLKNTDISILTCSSGDELYSTFGHTAIRIKNDSLDLDQVYNYGIFSFDTPNFYLKFMRGQLPYFLGDTKMSNFLREYQYYKRSVFEQKLNLSVIQKQNIITFLENNAQPENREYAYDFFFDNCATRVVDVYSLAGDNIKYNNQIEKKTFRELLKENLKNLPWSEFGIDIVIGARADDITNRRHQMFLPEYLMINLAHATIHDNGTTYKLAEEKSLVLDFESFNKQRKSKSANWPLISTFVLLLLTIVANIKKNKLSLIYNKTLLTISGILGLFLLFMWFGTNHGATRDNFNILWLNPFLLVLLYSRFKTNRVLRYAILASLSISLLNCFVTILPQFFHIAFAPIIVSIGVSTLKLILPKSSV